MNGGPAGGVAVWGGVMAALVLGFAPAGFADPVQHGRASRWECRAGYGYQYTNSTRPNHFQMVPLLPSTVIPMSGSMGPSWFRGKWEWNPELHLALFTHPYIRPLLGVTPIQFRWVFETPCRFKPYGLIGAGILYANINRRETRKDLNFNLQGALGTFVELNEATSLILEYRHVHVSNAGLHEDNAGMNNHTFLAGISFKK